jgi:hypothetical protein
MAKNEKTSAIVDGVIRATIAAGSISMVLLAPNILKFIDPATRKFLASLDERARERELKRCLRYALRERLITEHYQHGIVISKKGKKRLARRDYDTLVIDKTNIWDGNWRLVLFDIPAIHNKNRAQFTKKLRLLGFQPLQQSIWVIPYACKTEVHFVADTLSISKYITYIKTAHIDHEESLKDRFSID